MSRNDEVKKSLITIFRPFIQSGGGGLFTTKTRKRLLGILAASGRDRTKNQFWYDVRNKARNALEDLHLFVSTADEDQVFQVFTNEALEPVIRSLLCKSFYTNSESDPKIAEIANMLIQRSFDYFKEKASKSITLSHERTINEAVDLSNYLCQTIKGTSYSKPFDWNRH
jgi:hypothetical protein